MIFPAIGDGAAGNLGTDAIRPGWVAINFGTSAAVRAVPKPGTTLPFGLFQYAIDEQRPCSAARSAMPAICAPGAARAPLCLTTSEPSSALRAGRIAATLTLLFSPFG